ncbi:DNA adenine methylase [Helicobacter marmotae]|uniref:Site-specific DNA-methyltransferase (adenine-specific) n=1 Tax=Helicobacter marmotae TaxID=152490 RepID=A0A3D8I3P6_9HELI|nr:Dam family site-specific DNA-(adenine-N6)-methyltransferase [Helicobacter marmotae]RDU59626.1 DNA adenine methylase [Helicobacter marmotae]
MNNVLIPPLKIQGIKSKLVVDIQRLLQWDKNSGTYFEPFMGSGVVGFNIAPKKAIFSDNNPHIIRFYKNIQNEIITKNSMKIYLNKEGSFLQKYGQKHYLAVRERFNETHNSFDFLFLNRSCFNGLMRFNSKGGFNVPFCKKDNRFSQSYITKITNQIDWVSKLLKINDYEFRNCDFTESLESAKEGDFIYCDPPYIDRHSDYFNAWSESKERELYDVLSKTQAKFMLSTWHSNQYRQNVYMTTLWGQFNIDIVEHFYHLGASENNRNSIKESLVKNYNVTQMVDTQFMGQQSLFKDL